MIELFRDEENLLYLNEDYEFKEEYVIKNDSVFE